MRYSTGLVLAALSIGEVLATPTHAHLHKKAHQKKDVDYAKLDWDAMGIDWTSAWAAGQKTKTSSVAAPTVTPTAAATTKGQVLIEAVKTSSATKTASTTKAATTTSSSSSAVDSPFHLIVAAANSRNGFGEVTVGFGSEIGYVGNIGKPEGSNMMKVSSISGYDFTNTFINTSGGRITIAIWNKAATPAMAGKITASPSLGSSIAPLYCGLTFSLAAGETQVVAFANDTQIGWAQATTSLTSFSAFDNSWGEANYVSTGGGYDLSCIPNTKGNNYNMAISSSEVTCISDPTQNYWLADYTPIGNSDGSCFVPGSTMHLTTKMGGAL